MLQTLIYILLYSGCMEWYNPWWFGEADEGYEEWKSSVVKWIPPVLDGLELKPFALHFLVGPRQVGKTTALKILIHRALERGWSPWSIFYYSCDELSDYRELGEVIDSYLSARDERGIRSSLIALDEVTFVREWWRAVKSRIDRKLLQRDVIVVSGSASIELFSQRELFPGRRGLGRDIVMHPLSFSDYIERVHGLKVVKARLTSMDDVERAMKANRVLHGRISRLFASYMETGGFPLSIIDKATRGKVAQATLKAYLDWLKSDWSRAGKSSKYMREVIAYILRSRLTPVSWLSIARETSIASSHTAQSYVETLEALFTALVLNYMSPDGKVHYRKNKKIHLTDPLIYEVFSRYTGVEVLEETIAESTLASHVARLAPAFYWRNQTEVDVVAVIGGRQVGFEAKWSAAPWRKPKHLKTLLLDREKLPLLLASLETSRLSSPLLS